MKKVLTSVAGVALAALLIAGPTTEAKADGGAVAIGVGAYLLVDALVGRHCHVNDWPFNLVHEIGDELRGYPGCPHYRHRHYHRHHHHRHHRHH